MKTNNVITLIDTIRNLELTVALLYDTFSSTFPEDKYRWCNLADAERMHARWMGDLKAYHAFEIVSFCETRIIIQKINQFIDYLHDLIDRARKDEFTRRQAITLALEIENSLIAHSFLGIFSFHTPKARAVRNRLNQETKLHREKLLHWLEKIDNKSRMVA